MIMDAGEICRSYAAAKDKNDQIKVLADLNDCSTQEILDVLTGGGMVSGVPARAKQGLRWTPELDRELIKYCEQDLKPMEIAERMELDVMQVRNRKNKLKLKGYIFMPPKDDVSPAAKIEPGRVTMDDPAKSLQEDAPARPPGINPLAMLFDSLSLDMTVVSAAVRFMDERGECWKMELSREE